MLSHVWLFATPWTLARQAPRSLEFSRQEYWSRWPFPTSGDPLWPRDWTRLSCVSCIGRWILYHLGSLNNVYRDTKILLGAGNFWLDVSNKKLKRCKLGTNLYCIWAISVSLYVIPNIASYWAWLQDLMILWQQPALTKAISFLFMSNETECLFQ